MSLFLYKLDSSLEAHELVLCRGRRKIPTVSIRMGVSKPLPEFSEDRRNVRTRYCELEPADYLIDRVP
jgi:hypothetical protein